MMMFDHTGLATLLSVVVSVTMSVKVVTTVILLLAGKEKSDQPGWGALLWWATKITPVIFMPCLIAFGLLEGNRDLVLLGIIATIFVVLAVPLKIRQRRKRLAARGGN